MTVGAVLLGAVLIGAVVLSRGGSPSTGDLNTPQYTVPKDAPQDGMTLGSANAPVTLEIWSDFQCPSCGVFARETEPLLWETYIPNGTLKMVYKDAAFQGRKSSDPYDESVEAAAAARCAGQQSQYWQYADWLFWNQNGENLGAFKPARLQQIADAVGLDRTAWDACVAGGTQQPLVKASTDAAVAQGIDSTPTLYLNGVKYVGAMPYSQLAPLINAAAASAAPSGSAGASAGTSPSPAPSPSPSPAASSSPSPSGVSPSP